MALLNLLFLSALVFVLGCQPNNSGDLTTADFKSPVGQQAPAQGGNQDFPETDFIGSADDRLRAEVLEHLQQLSKTGIPKNTMVQAAGKIQWANFKLQKSSVKVQLVGAGSVTLSGTLDNESGISQLKVPTNNFLNIKKATVACLDENQERCQVALISLLVGQEKTPVFVLFRKTGAKLSRVNRLGSDSNSLFLFQYFQNTPKQSLNSLKKIELESSEVLLGQSRMKIKFETFDGHVFGIGGDLKKQNPGNSLNWGILKIEDVTADRSAMKTVLHTNLNKAQILSQSGRGEFEIRLFNKGSAQAVDVLDFWLQRHEVKVKSAQF